MCFFILFESANIVVTSCHIEGAEHNSVIKHHQFLVQWLIGLIPVGRPIELFFMLASAPQLYVLS